MINVQLAHYYQFSTSYTCNKMIILLYFIRMLLVYQCSHEYLKYLTGFSIFLLYIISN